MDSEKIANLLKQIESAQKELYKEIEKEEEDVFGCDFKKERVTLINYLKTANPKIIITSPIIYSMIIPALIMDIFVTIYQTVCFPIYGIPKVKRGDFIVFDRHRLSYLNILQKINCLYCSYFNGLIAYVREIASKTEQYWCPIKHSKSIKDPHFRYWRFLNYADADNLSSRWQKLREELKDES